MDGLSNRSQRKEVKKMNSDRSVQTMPKKRLFSIKQLVTEIGGTEWYWRCQIWEGRLPFVQVGRKMLIDFGDIEKFIQQNKFQN
jgi:hypothetical protein